MSWQHLLTTPVTIDHIGDGAIDGYGNPAKTATTETVQGYFEPIAEQLHLVESDTLVTTHELILPPGVALTANDSVLIDGVTYRVVEALHVSNARTGVDHHVEAKVVGITG